ncbi:proline-rich protein 2-like [Gouania willdenowi]|uniref:proline-rich protein 2-like n=1 Tax=Gouania willdenowi TaxID=441366 RepID=UPI001055A5C6|nr:proline-rich protein 2-like [Gouania willdenowi]
MLERPEEVSEQSLDSHILSTSTPPPLESISKLALRGFVSFVKEELQEDFQAQKKQWAKEKADLLKINNKPQDQEQSLSKINPASKASPPNLEATPLGTRKPRGRASGQGPRGEPFTWPTNQPPPSRPPPREGGTLTAHTWCDIAAPSQGPPDPPIGLQTARQTPASATPQQTASSRRATQPYPSPGPDASISPARPPPTPVHHATPSPHITGTAPKTTRRRGRHPATPEEEGYPYTLQGQHGLERPREANTQQHPPQNAPQRPTPDDLLSHITKLYE